LVEGGRVKSGLDGQTVSQSTPNQKKNHNIPGAQRKGKPWVGGKKKRLKNEIKTRATDVGLMGKRGT